VIVVVQSQSLKAKTPKIIVVFILEKTMMKYQVMIKTISGKGGEFWEVFKKMPTEPMKGIMIESSWSLFGYWDFVLFFKADSNDNSLHFVGEILRAMPGIAETSTSPMTMLKEHMMM
jgi:hypothetical protein